jgi:hypothetical protein
MRGALYTESFPGLNCNRLDRWFQLREPQEVHISILLLVLSFLTGRKSEGIQRIVDGGISM